MSEELYLYFMPSENTVSIQDFLKDKERIIAGRRKDWCDLHLAEHFETDKIMHLSRKHFMIYQRFSELFIEDLGSSHGTELDGKKLSPGVGLVLHAGRTIRLAQDDDFLIRVIDGKTIRDKTIGDQTIDATETMIDQPPEQPSPPKKESGSSSEEAQGAKENEKQAGLYFDEALDVFIVDGEAIHLPPTLDDLLKYLYNNAERSCSFNELRQNVWHGMAKKDAMRTAVHNLRRKLDKISPGAGGERYIKNLHGYGYKLTRK
jgi:pSer/pThr/pTyr-binding forkhead associated (FHA) protein